MYRLISTSVISLGLILVKLESQNKSAVLDWQALVLDQKLSMSA